MTGAERGGSAALLAGFLSDFLRSKNVPPELPEELSGIGGLPELYADMISLRSALLAVCRGDLSRPLEAEGYLPGVVKDLQAGLKQLTSQTQKIARGDFAQRIDFPGEFSGAFNAMVEHLHISVKALNKANRELLNEIEERKAAEKALRESEERFRRLSIIDPLTGLENRRHFFEMAEKEAERAHRYGGSFSLCIFDLDSFKALNDAHGHEAGDRALRRVADTTRGMLRNVDIVARYGGEEFIVAFPETGIREAWAISERIRKAIAASPVSWAGGSIRVTASFGVAAFDPDFRIVSTTYSESLQALIRRADEALYRAKNLGKNRVETAA